MSHARQMLETHPAPAQIDVDALVACIDACFDCAQTCTACADACLVEPDIATLVRCMALCQSCSDVCVATGRLLSRQTEFVPGLVQSILETCRAACRTSGEECERHAHHHEHCRICAEVCDVCAQACDALLRALPA